MEATAVSISKAVLGGALGYAKSKVAEEIALQLGIQRDVSFITAELQMMQSFLMTADEEQSQNKVLITWVKQIGELAYKVEDSLMDFGLHKEKKPFFGCIPRSPCDRRRIAKEVKEMRATVEDVSNRNLRYRLIKQSSGSMPAAAEDHSNIATAAMFGINEARAAALEKEKSEVNLQQLVASTDVDVRVIAVWGTAGDLGKMTAIQEVYDNPKVVSNFGFRAWVRLTHPFNPEEFIHSLVRQLYEFIPDKLGETKKKETIGSTVMKKMSQSEMIDVFDARVNDSRYLIVIDDLSTIVDWFCIKRFFPDNMKKSRIIISTQQAEIASLCTEQPYQVSELNQLSSDQTLYLFHKKINSEEQVIMAGASAAMYDINETKLADVKEALNVGLRQLINDEEKDLRVIVVKDTGGDLGKLSVIKEVYDDPTVNANFGLCAWVTLMHPFNPKEFIQSFVRQFTESSPDGLGDAKESTSDVPNKVEKMEQIDLVSVFDAQVRDSSYLFVINDLSTVEEWDCIKEYFLDCKNQSRIIVSTRQGVEITSLCTDQPYQMIELEQLSSDQTLRMFHEKAKDAPCSAQTISDSSKVTATEKNEATSPSEILELEQRPKNSGEDSSAATKKFDRSRTLALGMPTGRETEKSTVIGLVCQPDNNQGCIVISVWGMGGLGKTTLVRSVYQSQQLGRWKRAWATALRPFYPDVLLKDLALQLQKNIQDPAAAAATGAQKKNIAVMELKELKDEIARLLKSQKCLVVLDDISSTSEWELVKGCLVNAARIILTTREKNIAKHCSGDHGIMYNLQVLKDDAAFDLFIKKSRLVRCWIAEGYLRDMHGMTAEQLGRRYFDELLDRSMILPVEGVDHYSGKVSSCQLHDIIREICTSKAREENLVFTLEDGCSLNSTQGAIRHLVVGSNWKRDKDVLESMLDLSHVRSLTVFGDWRPFFISDKMRFLRVLDLSDTLGLRDHHLDQIGQLLHLLYLSLRDCGNIYCLPNSLGNLSHLQTLDVRGTRILEYPRTITKLRKLQNLHACWKKFGGVKGEYTIIRNYGTDGFTKCRSCCLFLSTVPLFLRPQALDDGLNRHDIFNLYRNDLVDSYGIPIPRGVGKMKALQTLCHVDIGKGKGEVALKELEELTQLRKLGVVGVTIKNSVVFWSAIAGLSQLRSLSVQADSTFGELDGFLGLGLSPPSCLESLKLTGVLVRMTGWVHLLQNLSKLTLENSKFEKDDAIQALGVLPNLAVLRLKHWSYTGTQLHFQNSSFPSLVVLELSLLPYLESVLFEEDTMPRLELLQVAGCLYLEKISGLPVLPSLREIRLGDCVSDELTEEVQRQVAEHLKHVRLNISI